MAEFVEVMGEKTRMCNATKNCMNCNLSSENNGTVYSCDYFMVNFAEKAEEIVMNWAEEHPLKTNADKFKEVFGFEADTNWCAIKCTESCCTGCNLKNFWNQEYKGE